MFLLLGMVCLPPPATEKILTYCSSVLDYKPHEGELCLLILSSFIKHITTFPSFLKKTCIPDMVVGRINDIIGIMGLSSVYHISA